MFRVVVLKGLLSWPTDLALVKKPENPTPANAPAIIGGPCSESRMTPEELLSQPHMCRNAHLIVPSFHRRRDHLRRCPVPRFRSIGLRIRLRLRLALRPRAAGDFVQYSHSNSSLGVQSIAQYLLRRVGCWRKHNDLERGRIWHSFKRRAILLEDLQFGRLATPYME